MKWTDEHYLTLSMRGVVRLSRNHLEAGLAPEITAEEQRRLQNMQRNGFIYFTPNHGSVYQRLFATAESFPPVLFAHGNIELLKRPAVAILGSRRPTPTTRAWSVECLIHSWSAESEYVVVSGGAIGCDQLAHTLALSRGVPTVAWLPTGLDAIYPRSLPSLFADFSSRNWLFLSPFWPNQGVRRHHFHLRNNWLVSHADAVCILQASLKSGSYMSGTRALAQGKPLGVVLSHPSEKAFLGNYQLWQDGAEILYDRLSVEHFLNFR